MVPLRTFYTLEIPSSQTACCFLVTHIQSKGCRTGSRSSGSRGKKVWQLLCNSSAAPPVSPPPSLLSLPSLHYPLPLLCSSQNRASNNQVWLYSIDNIEFKKKKKGRRRWVSPGFSLCRPRLRVECECAEPPAPRPQGRQARCFGPRRFQEIRHYSC